MYRNRNGYWMGLCWTNRFALDADDGMSGGGAPAGNDGDGSEADSEGTDSGEQGKDGEASTEALNAEIERLRAEMAKQKAAMDKAASEASAAKKALKAKMTQEEIDAASKQEADEKAAKELEELRREVAKTKMVRSVMGKLGTDEDTSGRIAESLYGAEDIDTAMLLIQKTWAAKEKALRMEFGKITGPGAGSGDGADSAELKAIERAKQLGRERADSNKNVAAGLQGYLR